MQNLTKMQLTQLCSIIPSPVFLLQMQNMIPMNQDALLLNIDTEDLLYCLPIVSSDEDVIAGYYRTLLLGSTERLCYSVTGRKILCEDQPYRLVEVLPINPQEVVPDVYQIASVREIMFNIFSEIDQLTTEQDIYDFILDNCSKVVAHSGLCSLMMVKDSYAEIVAQRGFESETLHMRLALEDTFPALETNGKFDRIVRINDLEKFQDQYCMEIRPKNGDAYLASTISTPLYINRTLYAILNFDSVHKNAFTEMDEQLLQLIKANIEIILTNHQMHLEIRQLSITDTLTGLYNRNYMEEFLNANKDQSYFIGILDMNSMKHINDSHGHYCGDSALKYFAGALQKNFHSSTMLFRMGGDEFICIFMNSNKPSIDEQICSLRRYLREIPLMLPDETTITLTFSCGFSYHDAGMPSTEAMIRADREMYEEKRAYKKGHPGKDCR